MAITLSPYKPLNLYSSFQESVNLYPNQTILFDRINPVFPELETETNYRITHDFIIERAMQLATAGIKAKDKVLLFKDPDFDTYLLAVALSYLGAVPVMSSYHLSQNIIEVFCDRLEDPFIIFDDSTKDRIKSVSNSSSAKQISTYQLLTLAKTNVKQTIIDLDEIAYITHTSGTTGIPKLICHSQNSMGYRVQWHKTIFSVINPADLVAFHISPVHSRFNIGISSIMQQGAPMLILSSFDLKVIKKMLLEHQPIALETHPNNFVQWIPLAKQCPEAFAKVKYYNSTFDAINLGTMKIFLTASSKNHPIFLQVYGQSECGPMIYKTHTLETIDHTDSRNMGVGLDPLTKVKICDKDGNSLPVNSAGNIHMLSQGRALKYYKEDQRFKDNLYGEWWDSGDFGKIDQDGYLYLFDRQVDLIDNIQSNLALEDLLLDQLTFLEEIIIVRGKDGSPQPILAIFENHEMDWQKWHNAIKDLPFLNMPIIKRSNEIPRTATMKVQRLQIESLLQQGLF